MHRHRPSNAVDRAPTLRQRASQHTPRRGAALPKVVAGLLLVGAFAGGVWMLSTRQSTAKADLLPATEIATAAVMSFDIRTTANGELAARRQTEIRNPLQTRATITEVIAEGTFARKGDLLVKLSTDTLEKSLIDAEDRLIAAENDFNLAETNLSIQLSDNDSALRQARLAVELAEIELKKWLEGDVRARRQELALGIERAEREVQRLTRKVALSRQLFEREFLSFDELELDEIALIEANSNLQTARIRSEVYEQFEYEQSYKQLTSNLEEARADLERVISLNRTQEENRRTALEYARTRREQRRTEVQDIRNQITASTIYAPAGGMVVYGTSTNRGSRWNDDSPIAIGKEVNPNEVMIILPDTKEMMAVVRVHEAMVGRVRRNQTAVIRIDAVNNQTFTGTVESIGILAESGGWRDPNLREYEVRIAVNADAESTGLKPSMRCEAEITLGSVADALAIPVQAIFNDGGISFVYKPEGGRFAPAPVVIGRRSSTLAEVLGGLSPGDRVLLREPSGSEAIRRSFDMDEVEALRAAAAERRGPDVRTAGGPAGAPPRAGAAPTRAGGAPAVAPTASAQGGQASPSTTAEAAASPSAAPTAGATPATATDHAAPSQTAAPSGEPASTDSH
jgi:HlyD family secretion protein